MLAPLRAVARIKNFPTVELVEVSPSIFGSPEAIMMRPPQREERRSVQEQPYLKHSGCAAACILQYGAISFQARRNRCQPGKGVSSDSSIAPISRGNAGFGCNADRDYVRSAI
jgi:hypothetical protein